MIAKRIALLAFIVCLINNTYAQRVAISTNLIEIASLSPSIGFELITSHHSSVSLNTSFAPWKVSSKIYNKHISLDFSYKYWFNQSLYAHYLSVNTLASSYDFKIGKRDYKGQVIGLGLGYGYSFVLNKHFNIIPNIGLGVGINTNSIIGKTEIKPIITNIGLNLQYIIK